jgi:hypothetical protein
MPESTRWVIARPAVAALVGERLQDRHGAAQLAFGQLGERRGHATISPAVPTMRDRPVARTPANITVAYQLVSNLSTSR